MKMVTTPATTPDKKVQKQKNPEEIPMAQETPATQEIPGIPETQAVPATLI